MQKSILKNEIILGLLVIISIAIIIILVPFSNSSNNQKNNKKVYKEYYVYDENSNPVSLSYKMLEYSKDTDKEVVIKNIFKDISKNISNSLKLKKIEFNDKEVLLTVNEILNSENQLNIDCLVNSLTDLANIDKVTFIVKKDKLSYESNINSYYINSPLVHKLNSFLYKDKNYNVIYLNELNEEVTFKIKNVEDNQTTFKVSKEKYHFTVKREGFYYNDLKILSNTYKVNDTWKIADKEVTITKVELQNDNTLLVTVNLVGNDEEEIITLKQGLGLYSYELIQNNETVKRYLYKAKAFIEN